jgi:heterodisulfide reductase subunit C
MAAITEALDLGQLDRTFAKQVAPNWWEKILSCIQCGTCSASCPAAHAMDISPRQMWRMVQLGMTEEVLRSKSIWLCSLCYTCHVRCPRGIPLTETIVRLKELAMERGIVSSPQSEAFYRAFAEVMRRYGRLREVEFMARYFLASNPLAALGFARLGLTMLARGKIRPELPRLGGEGRLDRLFARVAELEEKR